jgi:HEPN domain-containing protein
MPAKKSALGTAQEWLKRAKGNLALAKQPKPREAFWDDLCFDAQQAAEKSIKAVLVHRRIDFPKTHNIRALLELVDPTGSQISKEIWQAIDLTNYAVETRYPGTAEPVTKNEYRQAVALARRSSNGQKILSCPSAGNSNAC